MSTTKNLIKPTLLFYWRHAWRYPGKVWGLLLCAPLTLFFHQFLPPLLAANVIDKLSQGGITPNTVWHVLGADLFWFTASSMVGGIVLWRIFIYFNWSLEALVMRDIMRESFNHLMKLDTAFHANSFGGSLVSQTNKLVGSYIRIADAIQFQVYGLIISLVLSTIVLWNKSVLFVAAMWVVSALFFVFSFYMSRISRQRSIVEAGKQNKVTGFLADAITNVFAVKSFAASASESKRFDNATEDLRQATMGVLWATTRQEIVASSVTSTIYAAALFIAVISVVMFGSDISTVFLLVTYTTNISQRLWDLNTVAFRNLNRGFGDARDGIIALQTVPSVLDPAQPAKPAMDTGAIMFDNVTFTHDGSKDNALFRDFNLTVAAGEKVGLVGHSGSGKTSLTKLLLRYVDIDKGAITIDGQNIAAVTQDDLRRHISYVPQEPLLFHRSIRENIAYGKTDATMQEIETAAVQAHAAEFIDTLPDKYETLVGERGVKLSGGQRQRIAIARAMIKNAPILVLDEATSALDSESEALIQRALWKLMEGRTAIVIAHRLSTIQKMDRIIVLDEGKIVEQGSHEQLIRKAGKYAKLWAHQSGGFIED
jgi:ATP-binding cassette subfamily B protein